VIDTNSEGGEKRSSLYGAWPYIPWGPGAFCGSPQTGRCSLSETLAAPADDSLNFKRQGWGPELDRNRLGGPIYNPKVKV
jgi:hypothetical protein